MWQDATFETLVRHFIDIISVLVFVIFALTLVVMLWKIIDAWILRGGDPTAIEEGKKTALVGIIVLVLMVSVWGIVAFLQAIFY